jgi:uncharacterized glyoxalase superfamily protein PhnB
MVKQASQVIEFLTRALGARQLRRFDGPDGAVVHAEMQVDDSVVMLSEGSPDYPAFPAWVHVYVRDVDTTYQQALAAGGVAVQSPRQSAGDPDRRGGVKDPAGNTWWLSTQQSTGG